MATEKLLFGIYCYESGTIVTEEDFNCMCLHNGWCMEEKLCSDEYAYVDYTNSKNRPNGQTTSTAFKD